jgi:hypothetical protein
MGGIRPLITIRSIGENDLLDGLIYLLSFVESVDLVKEYDCLSGYHECENGDWHEDNLPTVSLAS